MSKSYHLSEFYNKPNFFEGLAAKISAFDNGYNEPFDQVQRASLDENLGNFVSSVESIEDTFVKFAGEDQILDNDELNQLINHIWKESGYAENPDYENNGSHFWNMVLFDVGDRMRTHGVEVPRFHI